MPRLTDASIPELTSPSGDDWIHIVDVDDTTQHPLGSSKKIKRSNLAVTSLAAMSDVSIVAAANGQTLRYNSSSAKWVNNSFLFNDGVNVGVNRSSSFSATCHIVGTSGANALAVDSDGGNNNIFVSSAGRVGLNAGVVLGSSVNIGGTIKIVTSGYILAGDTFGFLVNSNNDSQNLFSVANDKTATFFGKMTIAGDVNTYSLIVKDGQTVELLKVDINGTVIKQDVGLYALRVQALAGTPLLYVQSNGFSGFAGITTPLESIHSAGAIIIGDATSTNNGTIRYTGTDFEGRVGGLWKSLTAGAGVGAAGGAGAIQISNGAGGFTHDDATFTYQNTGDIFIASSPVVTSTITDAINSCIIACTGTNTIVGDVDTDIARAVIISSFGSNVTGTTGSFAASGSIIAACNGCDINNVQGNGNSAVIASINSNISGGNASPAANRTAIIAANNCAINNSVNSAVIASTSSDLTSSATNSAIIAANTRAGLTASNTLYTTNIDAVKIGAGIAPVEVLHVNGKARFDNSTAASAGASSGTFLVIDVDGTNYKLDLLNNA